MTSAGSVRSRPFGITWRVPITASGTIGRPAWIASRKLPALNRATRPSQLRVPSAKMISDSPSDTSARQRFRMPARSGCRRSTNRWPPRLRCQPSTGKPGERLLRDDPQLIRQRREEHRRVVDALVIRHEHVGRAGRDALEAFNRDADAGRLQNQPRPRARAAMREVAAPIEQARDDRRRAEHDGVDA